MWATGAASGPEVGITIALALSAAGMTAIPFAMAKARNLGEWGTYLALGLILATFNYTMAVDIATKWRNDLASPAAVSQLRAAALDKRETAATAALAQLPQLPHTTAAMVTAAKTAAGAAKVSREDECRRRGTFCREREADERAALAAQSTAEANRANTVKRELLEAEVKAISAERVQLGPVPKDVDAGAAKLGKVLSKLFDMGDRPDLVVLDWMPTMIAAVIELIGLLLPRVILTATGHAEERPRANGACGRRSRRSTPGPPSWTLRHPLRHPALRHLSELPQLPHRRKRQRKSSLRQLVTPTVCCSGRGPAPSPGPAPG